MCNGASSRPTKCFYFYRPRRSLGQGNVFTNVCSSVHEGGGLHQRVKSASRAGGSASGGGWADPPPRILRDTANKRAVRVLLERILVLVMQKFIHGWFIVFQVETFDFLFCIIILVCRCDSHWRLQNVDSVHDSYKVSCIYETRCLHSSSSHSTVPTVLLAPFLQCM